jgi:hypothetical protein
MHLNPRRHDAKAPIPKMSLRVAQTQSRKAAGFLALLWSNRETALEQFHNCFEQNKLPKSDKKCQKVM